MNVQKKSSVTIIFKIVGTLCNMKCSYCYEHVQNTKSEEFSNYEDIECFLKNYTDVEHVLILFHGGEPLLASPTLVESIILFVVKNFKGRYSFQFQTNGTLINDTWLKLFEKYPNIISVSVSLDPIGEKDLRNMHNEDYRPIVISNIKKICRIIDNVGIISVIHKYNIKHYIEFVEDMMELQVRSFTVNKFQGKENDKAFIKEVEYVDFLKKLAVTYINKAWYRKINIQPIIALFSYNKNKFCHFLAEPNKCSYFVTYYNKNKIYYHCDHIIDGKIPELDKKCSKCSIYEFCGGGCFKEIKDSSFCDSRKDLFDFIMRLKNGNI